MTPADHMLPLIKITVRLYSQFAIWQTLTAKILLRFYLPIDFESLTSLLIDAVSSEVESATLVLDSALDRWFESSCAFILSKMLLLSTTTSCHSGYK